MKKIYWPVTLFLILNPLITVLFLILNWTYLTSNLSILLFSLIFAAITNLTITAGYHRLFSHKSYDAHPFVQFLFLFFGASAFQGSALKWSSDHRKHHTHIDGDKDPYNIHRGFWFAHMGWMFLRETIDQPIHAPDLQKNKLVKLQHDYYVPIAILSGFLFPAFIGYLFGNTLAGFVIGGGLRIALTQQSTFFVNSLCHTLGKQTYSKEISARDSWFVAVLTHGEGYHNFHHKFQFDYRNGIQWYQWDPTKWVIQSLAMFGLATKLRQMSNAEILKAKLHAEEHILKAKGLADDKIQKVKNKIIEAQARIRQLNDEYQKMKNSYSEFSNEIRGAYEAKSDEYKIKLAEIKREMAIAKIEFKAGLQEWRVYARAYSV